MLILAAPEEDDGELVPKRICGENLEKEKTYGINLLVQVKIDMEQLNAVKEELHVSRAPSNLLCREIENNRILEFCKQAVEQEKTGSLYICGCPGTGMSLSMEKVNKVLVNWAEEELKGMLDRTNRFDAQLKVALLFALPALFGIWLGLSIVGSVLSEVGYGFFDPWVSAFETFRHDDEFNKFVHCIVDGTWGTIKGSYAYGSELMDPSTKSRVMMVVKVSKKLIKWFGNCEMTPTLAEISRFFELPYIKQMMIRARTQSPTWFLHGYGLKGNDHLMCLKQSWVSFDYLYARSDVIDRCVSERVKAMNHRMRFDKFSLPIGIDAWIEFLESRTEDNILWTYLWFHPNIILCGCRVQPFLVLLGINCTRPYSPFMVMHQLGRLEDVLPVMDLLKDAEYFKDQALGENFPQAWASGIPPPPLPKDLGNISNCPPLSQVQFFAPVESPEHAPGFTPRQYYPGTSSVPLAVPQPRPATQPVPPAAHVFVVQPPLEAPTYTVRPVMVLPRSASDPVLKVSDSHYFAPEPTLKMNETYGYTQLPTFSFDTEKPVAMEEQEVIARKLKSLEQAMRNLQGIGGYKSVSYKYLCMFPDVNLLLGFKMPKFEKYAGHGDPVVYLRRYYNQLRAAGGREELLMDFFSKSLSSLASEWFVDQDIDNWNN
ncbi:hypothetical protein FXO38_15028 [Capsicum annuum]|nr:hypothetical protein FXO38_15028 [Capsicum annuum]KAF3677209.1 hypothetical protein FXO37_04934 [Capsicum annuum]